MLKGRDVVSIRDIAKSDIELLLRRAEEMEAGLVAGTPPDSLRGKIVSTVFFEPSTRTKMCFQAAVKRLGGQILNLTSVQASSMKKGESLSDTLRIIDGYSDMVIIRHALDGSARYAADICAHPVINAGDGGNQHPTQTLLDLYAIRRMKGRIDGLDVFLVGDLKHARTMKSLLYGLALFKARVTLVSPQGLEMNPKVVEEVRGKFKAEVAESGALDLKQADVAYVCRVQKERFADPYEAELAQKKFMVTTESLKGAKGDLVLLHPLPKVDEIAPEIDGTKHAKYFEQARLGVPMRMALMAEVLGV
ncbi:MAG: aspartate carbamoyltransferase [Candidatus ainarchaeum sp.]|nr:aspartate carbamoyltransferase [Candidatus ainarchaeum sp.]